MTSHLSAPFSSYLIKISTRKEKFGSIQVVMFLARTQVVGLYIALTEYRVYPGIFRPLIWSLQYHHSCISAMSIPLTVTVLVRILEAIILCCRLKEWNWIHNVTFRLFHIFLPFWFDTQKGEDGLSYATERSTAHSLQRCDRCVDAEHKADATVFLFALTDSTGWCPVPHSACKAAGYNSPYPPQGPETRPPLFYRQRATRSTILILEPSHRKGHVLYWLGSKHNRPQ